MNRETIKQTLIDLLADDDVLGNSFDKSLISEDTSLRAHLPMDSLRILTYLINVQKKFDIKIDPSELPVTALEKFSALVDYIETRV